MIALIAKLWVNLTKTPLMHQSPTGFPMLAQN